MNTSARSGHSPRGSQQPAKDLPPAPSGSFTPGQHLQAIFAAFFSGGGWARPLTWDDYGEEGRAIWERHAEAIGRGNIRKMLAGADLYAALKYCVEALELAADHARRVNAMTDAHLWEPGGSMLADAKAALAKAEKPQ